MVGFPGAERVTNAELLELDCDVLIPAALENQITAKRRRASRPASSPRPPTARPRPEADDILYDRGVFVIPDILCNAGGVTVSYFEWVQDMQSFFWTEARINESLHEIMDRAFESVHDMSRSPLRPHAHRRLHGRGGARGRGHDTARPVPLDSCACSTTKSGSCSARRS